MRVISFFQSCSPPRLAILLLVLLLLQFLLDHVCINFHLHFRLANSSPSSLPTSQLSVHRWTSTWDLPSSVRTAGPQPRTFPAQCAPLDLNLGPSQLSAHRWTGPHGAFRAQWAPLDLNLAQSTFSLGVVVVNPPAWWCLVPWGGGEPQLRFLLGGGCG